jgi:hypothetical protein
MKEIWPLHGDDTLIQVDDKTWNLIKNSAGLDLPDDSMWEFARKLILSDREATQVRERHARGDYGPELRDVLASALNIIDRTDGDSYHIAEHITDKVHDMMEDGFTQDGVGAMQHSYNLLTNELQKTTEMAVKLGGLIRELKGE